MAIRVLLSKIHSAWYNFKLFFQVLFWIYIHYNRPNKKGNIVNRFNKWNFINTKELAEMKKGAVANKEDFLKTTGDNFLLYYQLLIPWVNRL